MINIYGSSVFTTAYLYRYILKGRNTVAWQSSLLSRSAYHNPLMEIGLPNVWYFARSSKCRICICLCSVSYAKVCWQFLPLVTLCFCRIVVSTLVLVFPIGFRYFDRFVRQSLLKTPLDFISTYFRVSLRN